VGFGTTWLPGVLPVIPRLVFLWIRVGGVMVLGVLWGVAMPRGVVVGLEGGLSVLVFVIAAWLSAMLSIVIFRGD